MEENLQNSLNFRLKVFMDYTGLNNSQFADKCEVPRPSFSQIITGRNKKVSDILLTQLHNAFPELNMLWLVFGEGEMLVTPDNCVNRNGMELKSKSSPYSLDDSTSALPFADVNTTDEIKNFPTSVGDVEKNGREMAPISAVFRLDNVDIERVSLLSAQKTAEEIRSEIEKPQRRVVRITVFYDDNSYESFSPTEQKV